jgi:uroporphyrinogen-III synthase
MVSNLPYNTICILFFFEMIGQTTMAASSVVTVLLLSAASYVTSFSNFIYHHDRRLHSQATPDLEMASGESSTNSLFVVALTREEGKNDKLNKAIQSNSKIKQIVTSSGSAIEVNEIPCIAHADGPDTDILGKTLSSSNFDYVAITSPEAAKVFAAAWSHEGRPKIGLVAAVGTATEETLKAYGVEVCFVPSKATAATLVQELPTLDAATNEGRPTTVLYPASAKAQDTLQNGLEDRGFMVTRLNTYDTVTATWTTEEESMAKSTTVACFASPSAVKAWLKNSAQLGCPRALAACIGETSFAACRKNGWKEEDIFYPEKPGIDGWAEAVADALQCLSERGTF